MLIVESGEQTRKILQGGLHTALCWFSTSGFMRTVFRCKQASEQSTILFTQGMELETLEEQEIRWFLGDFHI
jgi:hypothetical protein